MSGWKKIRINIVIEISTFSLLSKNASNAFAPVPHSASFVNRAPKPHSVHQYKYDGQSLHLSGTSFMHPTTLAETLVDFDVPVN